MFGGMVEWFIAPVLKTGDPQGSVGSNPTPSARLVHPVISRTLGIENLANCFELAR